MLRENRRIQDLAMTTNGVQLAEHAQALRDAGLDRITLSLDTLRADRFRALTRRDTHSQVLRGLEAAHRAGFGGTKIDTVLMRGVNDDELSDLLEFGKQRGVEVRFIEYMDVGGATEWSMEKVFSRAEILDLLARQYGEIKPVVEQSSAPAERFLLPDGTVFGIIASTTTPFCRRCDRSRLTADGIWYLCLYAQQGTDLRQPLRAGAPREELISAITSAWHRRNDRGAEEREAQRSRTVLVGIKQLREDPHLEMHTRGG
jgi:GTP 3',8-cyclase